MEKFNKIVKDLGFANIFAIGIILITLISSLIFYSLNNNKAEKAEPVKVNNEQMTSTPIQKHQDSKKEQLSKTNTTQNQQVNTVTSKDVTSPTKKQHVVSKPQSVDISRTSINSSNLGSGNSAKKIDTGNSTPKPSLAPSSKVAETSSTTPSSAKDTRPSGVGNPADGGGHPGIDALREPDFGPYMRDVQKKIKSNWDPPEGDKSKRVVLLFKIAKDGSLLSCSVKKSSWNSNVDYAAIKAVKQTAPFPPLPPEFKGQSIDIQFTFDYNVFTQLN